MTRTRASRAPTDPRGGWARPLVDLAVLDIAGTTVEEHGAVYTAMADAVIAAGASPSRSDIEQWMGADKHEAIAARDDAMVDAVVTVDEVPAGRPAPFMIFHAMERNGAIDVARVVVAGDTVRDLESGVNAGAGFVIGVLTGGHDAATLGAARHTHLLGGVRDIPTLVL